MGNMLDYILWRGDLSFSSVPFSEVDGLILSQMSMLFWENGIDENDAHTVAEMRELLSGKPVSSGFTAKNDAQLLHLTSESIRFGNIVLSNFEHIFDASKTIQFAAATFRLPDGTSFISFRGTDNTLVGWKEDFNMTYAMPIPAQLAASDYFNRVSALFPGDLYVGGHSKGGNLAMYAAAQAEPHALARIIRVYNNDGPGFNDRDKAEFFYNRIKSKLVSFIPQSSVIGMLLAHPDSFEIIQSDSKSILQHDPYSWQVKGGRFVRNTMLTNDSIYIQSVIKQWLAGLNDEDRRLFIESLFHVIESTNARRFGNEFWKGILTHPSAFISSFGDISPASRKRIKEIVIDLGKLVFSGNHFND